MTDVVEVNDNVPVNPRPAIVALAVASTLSACSPVDQAASPPVEAESLAPASSLPARWWLWVESAGARNPVSDPSGRFCTVNQPADVWFLAGTYGGTATRTCTIPADRPIFFPVMNLICEVPPGGGVQDALDECDPRPETMSAQIDGKGLTIVEATSEGAFTFTAGSHSVIGTPGERFEAVAGGTWVGPMNLTAGDHVLSFEATSVDFDLDVTYHLTVE